MKTVCVYHSIDLDGWMSAAIVKHWFTTETLKNLLDVNMENPNTIEFLGYNYGQPIPDLSEYDKVIMCDIAFPKEEMLKLFKRLDNRFIWIDHHVSAIKEYGKLDEFGIEDISTMFNGYRRIDFAACELTWTYFLGDQTMPEIVRLLGRYDCFGSKGTSEELKVLHFQYAARESISNYEEAYVALCNDLDHNITEEMIRKGIFIYNYLCTEAEQVYKNGFKVTFFETTSKEGSAIISGKVRKFICFYRERFNPINFGIDYHKDGYDGAASFYYNGHAWKFSLYNENGEVDCSVLAKQYDENGGGHRGAAGFMLNNEKFLKFILANEQ